MKSDGGKQTVNYATGSEAAKILEKLYGSTSSRRTLSPSQAQTPKKLIESG